MSVPVLTFFNNKGGVGKTSLVYHLAWMLAATGKRVVTVDLDPQANLTAAFLEEDELESLWDADSSSSAPTTVYRALKPLTEFGNVLEPILHNVCSGLDLVPGDVALAGFEETLSEEWPNSMRETSLARPFRILTAFWEIAQLAARRVQADIIIVDVGPNLGAINRSVLLATDYVVMPLGADLFSLQGLKNLGPTLRSWRSLWHRRLDNWPEPSFSLPRGHMTPLGYIIQQHSVRLSRPVRAYDRWVSRVPSVYRESVLQQPGNESTTATDSNCLATVKHYRSLVPLAQEARKPIFQLTPADGAIGAHAAAVQEAFSDFKILANKILNRMTTPELILTS